MNPLTKGLKSIRNFLMEEFPLEKIEPEGKKHYLGNGCWLIISSTSGDYHITTDCGFGPIDSIHLCETSQAELYRFLNEKFSKPYTKTH